MHQICLDLVLPQKRLRRLIDSSGKESNYILRF